MCLNIPSKWNKFNQISEDIFFSWIWKESVLLSHFLKWCIILSYQLIWWPILCDSKLRRIFFPIRQYINWNITACVNTSFDVLEVHLQWDDHWMIVVTAFQTIPWVFTWETWIALPVSSHIVQFLDAHDSFNYSFFLNRKESETERQVNSKHKIIQKEERWKVTIISDISRSWKIYDFAMVTNF